MSRQRQPPPAQPPSKHDLLQNLLDEGMTMVHLDARVDGVDVPAQFRTDPHLRLNLSRRFNRPLTVLDDRVEAELTFGGRAHLCLLPFSAVFGMSSHETGKTLMWPEDIPQEVLLELERPPPPTPPAKPRARARPQPSVKLAPVPEPQDAMEQPPPPEIPPSPPRRGHLRLVK